MHFQLFIFAFQCQTVFTSCNYTTRTAHVWSDLHKSGISLNTGHYCWRQMDVLDQKWGLPSAVPEFFYLFFFFSALRWKSVLSKLRCRVLFWKRQVLINITPTAQTVDVCCQRSQRIHNPAPPSEAAASHKRHPALTHMKRKECLSIP